MAIIVAFAGILCLLECTSVLYRVFDYGFEVDAVVYVSGALSSAFAVFTALLARSREIACRDKSPERSRLAILVIACLFLFSPLQTFMRDARVLDISPLPLPYLVNLPGPLPIYEHPRDAGPTSPGALCRLWEDRGLRTKGLIRDSRSLLMPYFYFCDSGLFPVMSGKQDTNPNNLMVSLFSSVAQRLAGQVNIDLYINDPKNLAPAVAQFKALTADLYGAYHAKTPPALLSAMDREGNASFTETLGIVEVSRLEGAYLALRMTSCDGHPCSNEQLPQLPFDPRFGEPARIVK